MNQLDPAPVTERMPRAVMKYFDGISYHEKEFSSEQMMIVAAIALSENKSLEVVLAEIISDGRDV